MTFPLPFLQRSFREFEVVPLGTSDTATLTSHTFALPGGSDEGCFLLTCQRQSSGSPALRPDDPPTLLNGPQMELLLDEYSTANDDGYTNWYSGLQLGGQDSVTITTPSLLPNSEMAAYMLCGMLDAGPLLSGYIFDTDKVGNKDGGAGGLSDLVMTVNTLAANATFAIVGTSANTDVTGEAGQFRQDNFGFDMDHPGGSFDYTLQSSNRIGTVIVFSTPT